MKTCLSIAGSDSSGGAGIQADLKTFTAHGVYGMTAITALTAQNTLGVHAVSTVKPELVAAQIDAVFTDIRPNAVKIGMLANTDIIQVVAQRLRFYQAKNVVLDPVMIATSGAPLLDQNAVRSLIDELIPVVDLLTPNTAELIALCQTQGIKIDSDSALSKASLKNLTKQLFGTLDTRQLSILSKGGHLNSDQAADYLLSKQGDHWFETPRLNTQNTHGTGCTLSAAIASNLALENAIDQACLKAKNYLTKALKEDLNLGQGNGPLNHLVT